MSREDILRALREEFRANTRERLVEMADLLDRTDASPDRSTFTALERHFHGLAGLGGTYGYDMVTTLGREGEDMCAGYAGNPVAADRDRLSGLLAQLREAIELDPDSE